MVEHMGKLQWKKQIRFYGILIGLCLILAVGINALMDQGRQDMRESEPLRSLRSDLEQYRKVHGDKPSREDLVNLWKSYEGKLSPKEIEQLKQEYRAKLDPAEAEALKQTIEDVKGKKP
jgi:FPC/CPF motif-containing protein YcgG